MTESDGPQTPIAGSGAYPLLRQMAEQEAERLERIATGPAGVLRQRLRALAAILRSWSPEHRPTDDERRRLVDELVAALSDAQRLR